MVLLFGRAAVVGDGGLVVVVVVDGAGGGAVGFHDADGRVGMAGGVGCGNSATRGRETRPFLFRTKGVAMW